MISSDAGALASCDKYILPGVGAFDAGMENLKRLGLSDFIRTDVLKRQIPLLGICLGMQLLGRRSEEGNCEGLGLVPFDNVKFAVKDQNLKIPHMGWDVVEFKKDIPLLKNIEGQQRYYFVHSYHALCDSEENVMMTCNYGYEFAAAVVSGNIMGVQFHPEKSHDFGMRLLRNFVGEY